MNNHKVIAFLIIIVFFNLLITAQQKNKLWYNKPAQHFEESLVLGNGKMGASVFGGVQSDKIYLNDITLWSGEPVDANMNPDASKYIPAIRKALFNEDYKKADSLNRFLQGSYSESYAPLGTIFIDFSHSNKVENYYRELNIGNAVSKTNYNVDNAEFEREYFISYSDKVMAIKLTANKEEKLNCSIRFESLLKFKTTANKNTFEIDGYAPYYAAPNYLGNIPNAVLFDEKRGTRFTTLIRAKETDGTIFLTDSSLTISNATNAIILISIETSFNGYDKNPATEGKDNKKLALENLRAASKKSYEKLKENHVKDYKSFFNRVDLSLNEYKVPNLPTDERLKLYSEGNEDKNLEILYFQYGRYLLISSSRTEEVAANLQGLWNPYLRPPWSSNYTLNINAEENYWLSEIGNLSEMHNSLLTLIGNIAETGKTTAKNFYGTNGWVACHNSDIWAMSNPVGDFGSGDPVWANWNMGGVWLTTHLWEHYLFTQNKKFLYENAYPIMKGAVEFCLDWLVEDKDGYLITAPATSPENYYRTPAGYLGATLYGATADIAMIRELFKNFMAASKVLQIDDKLLSKVKEDYDKLLPYKIGKKGNLQEWYHDWEDPYPQHRHQTHLFGLYPGHSIHPAITPKLADACKTTLEIKGDKTTGWSKGWRINLWARLWDGNRAYKMYKELLRYVEPTGPYNTGKGGGTYPNLFDAHPPFQIDGNFGGAAAVIEMLMQSTKDKIYILPALPDAWESGAIKGICARGGFELEIAWEDRKLTNLNIKSKNGGRTTVIYGDKEKFIQIEKDEILRIEM